MSNVKSNLNPLIKKYIEVPIKDSHLIFYLFFFIDKKINPIEKLSFNIFNNIIFLLFYIFYKKLQLKCNNVFQ